MSKRKKSEMINRKMGDTNPNASATTLNINENFISEFTVN
jgi:hypothetical protein